MLANREFRNGEVGIIIYPMLFLGYVELLVFTDDYFHSEDQTPVVQALQRLTAYYEITWTLFYQDPAGFASALATSPAHMAVVDNNCFYSLSDYLDEIYNWALAKPLIIASFNVDTAPDHPLWALAGASWRGDVREDTLVFLPDLGIFNYPEDVPDTLKLSKLYEDRGDSLSSSLAISVFEGGAAAASMGSGCRVALVGFLPAEADDDLDLDGVPDGVEFYEDLIWYMMECNGLTTREEGVGGLSLKQAGSWLLASSQSPTTLRLFAPDGRLAFKRVVRGAQRIFLGNLRRGVYIAKIGHLSLKVLVK